MKFNIDLKAEAKKALTLAGKAAIKIGKEGAQAAVEGVKRLKELAKAVEDEIRADVESVKARDPAAKNGVEIVLLYSGVHAIFAYRVSHKLYLSKHYFSARLISQLAKFLTGIEILIMMTKISKRESYHVADFVAGGDGYFACNGKLIPIKWHCDDEHSPFYFTTVEGKPLDFGVGSSYIAIAPLDSPVVYGALEVEEAQEG